MNDLSRPAPRSLLPALCARVFLNAVSLFLASGPGALPATTRPSESHPEARIEAVVERLQDPSEERCVRLRAVLAKLGPLLAHFPSGELRSVCLAETTLEFCFDFGRRDRRIVLPAREGFLWDADEGKPIATRSAPYKLLLRDRVRLRLAGTTLVGIEKGDLRLEHWLKNQDVALREEHRPDQVAADGEGRPLLRTDPDGQPLVIDAGPVFLRSDRWLVFEVAGRRIEVPLDVPVP